MNDKSKGGRPPAPPGLRRVNVPVRLPEWMVEWMTLQWMVDADKTAAALIEAAMVKSYKLHPPHGAGVAKWRKADRVRAIVNVGPFPGMSDSFDAHMGAACWTDPTYAQDASTWAAAWKAAKRAAP